VNPSVETAKNRESLSIAAFGGDRYRGQSCPLISPTRQTGPRCSVRLHDRISRWVVNIDQFPNSLALYIFRMEKRKETDQETIELLRQYFSDGNRSEPAILVVASPQRNQVSSASSKAASDACSSRAEGDQLDLL
jgi:hypothetical protein